MASNKKDAKASQICAGYKSGTYKCPGHEGLRPSNVPDFSEYYKGDVVETPDLNKLRQVIQAEIDTRKNHIWYRNGKNGVTLNGLTLEDVSKDDLIDHPQQNDVAECVNALNTLINLYGSSDTQKGKKKTGLSQVQTDDLVEAKNLKEIEEALMIVTTDCICYSDCTSYRGSDCTSHCRWHSTCSCNANCCHYGLW